MEEELNYLSDKSEALSVDIAETYDLKESLGDSLVFNDKNSIDALESEKQLIDNIINYITLKELEK